MSGTCGKLPVGVTCVQVASHRPACQCRAVMVCACVVSHAKGIVSHEEDMKRKGTSRQPYLSDVPYVALSGWPQSR